MHPAVGRVNRNTACGLSRALIDSVRHSIATVMRRIFNMDDRARLRERFFGASLTILARL